MSGGSKLAALIVTYPYQVIRSRIQVSPPMLLIVSFPHRMWHAQNNTTSHIYPNIRTCIRRTFASEGMAGFYRGLGTNLVRVLPGTCVTFVVYENIAWLLRMVAVRRDERRRDG